MLFLPGVRSEHFDALEALHKEAFVASLIEDGATKVSINRACVALGSIQVDSKTDRSVQSTMRMAVEDIRYAFLDREPSVMRLNIAEVTQFLNDRPCTVYGDFIQPNKAMRASIPE
jgi:hypothetical protein